MTNDIVEVLIIFHTEAEQYDIQTEDWQGRIHASNNMMENVKHESGTDA